MWQNLSTASKFSIIACGATLAISFLSLGILGAGLYYLTQFLPKSIFPEFDSLHGDWVWPATILAGMIWSLGFIISGITFHYLTKLNMPVLINVLAYLFILWIWALTVWYILLNNRI